MTTQSLKYQNLFKLLQIALNTDEKIIEIKDIDWEEYFTFLRRQAIVGVGYDGVEKLSKHGVKPPFELLMNWIALVEQVEGKNKILNQKCHEMQEVFHEGGFRSCILKGQGNALMYPKPLRRQSGDIDIWVDGNIKDIVEFLYSKYGRDSLYVGYHHGELHIWDDVEVEVHWRPSWKSSPLHNYRMQRWFETQAERQFNNELNMIGLCVPTKDFNVVFQMQHMYLHLLQEGLGLRQVIDYYYVLKSKEACDLTELQNTLKYLDLWKFASALMYVMKEVLNLDEGLMIAPVDEKSGERLLDEIIMAGNFGQYDERNRKILGKKGSSRRLARISRQLRFLKDYPVEVLCTPFQLYHVIWRKLGLWKWQ